MRYITALAALLLFPSGRNSYAQYFAFSKNDTVRVVEGSDTLSIPWAGGLNYGQPSAIDMNYDGSEDLFVFDRTGNRVITLQNDGIPSQISYTCNDAFRSAFPPLSDWVLLEDYDGDGNKDIFTYYSGGVRVYRNAGDSGSGLQFALVKSHLVSNYNPNTIVLYVSLADIPAITDIDDDGDVDILTFNFLGGCVEYHRNMSMELYGHADSLVYRLQTDNWGKFTEGASSLDINLSDSCDTAGVQRPSGQRHAGSSLLALDLDGDNDKDLVLGDVGGTHLTSLRNGGSNALATVTAVDFNFPQNNSSTLPVNMNLFPTAYFLDVNNDGKRDLLVAPNAPGSSETSESLWRYMNNGTDDFPDFKKQQENFLQKDMIELGEGAFPVFFDYDRDGLQDLVIGNTSYWTLSGQLALYRNAGTAAAPSFKLVTRDFAGMAAANFFNLVPAFGDLDGDGDEDMLVGDVTGYIHFYENIAPVLPNTPAVFAPPLLQYFNIKENSFSAPAIIDLDGDGVNDIVCGSRLGRLNYYRNSGTAGSAAFTASPTISQLGDVSVVDPLLSSSGYSIPCFFTHNGKRELFAGSYRGTVFHYSDLDYSLSNPAYTLKTNEAGGIRDGIRSGVAVTDLNGDAFPDLVYGNLSGGVSLYYGIFTDLSLPPGITGESFQIYPNPAAETVTLQPDISFSPGYIYFVVCNQLGQELLSGKFSGGAETLDVSGLAPGMYVVKIGAGAKVLARKKLLIR